MTEVSVSCQSFGRFCLDGSVIESPSGRGTLLTATGAPFLLTCLFVSLLSELAEGDIPTVLTTTGIAGMYPEAKREGDVAHRMLILPGFSHHRPRHLKQSQVQGGCQLEGMDTQLKR